MHAFIPVLLSSLAATSYAAPIPSPEGPNGGILGGIIDEIKHIEAEINSFLPNITDVVHSDNGAQALAKIVGTIESDLFRVGGAIGRELIGDLNTIENVNHDILNDFDQAVTGLLDTVEKAIRGVVSAADNIGGTIGDDITGALNIISGFETFLKNTIKGVISHLL